MASYYSNFSPGRRKFVFSSKQGFAHLYLLLGLALVFGIVGSWWLEHQVVRIGERLPVVGEEPKTSQSAFLTELVRRLFHWPLAVPAVQISLDHEPTSTSVYVSTGTASVAAFLERGGVGNSINKREPRANPDLARISSTPKLFIQSSSDILQLAESSPALPDCRFSGGFTSRHSLLLNEIAWMGSPSGDGEILMPAAQNEWIELKNISDHTLDLRGSRIIDQSGQFKIIFDEHLIVPVNGFVLLARGDATVSVLHTKTDKVYAGRLSNAGVWLKLFNDHCELVDEIKALSGWPAGNRETKQTLERDRDGFGWHTSLRAGGTPKAENTIVIVAPAETKSTMSVNTNQSTENSTTSSLTTTSNQAKVLITEIQLASVTNVHDEFIELYNPTDRDLLLTSWYLQKKTKSAASFETFVPKDLLFGRVLGAHRYLIAAHPSSTVAYDVATDYGLALDNTVVVKNPDGQVVDKVGWGEAGDCEGSCALNPSPGQSLARRFESGWFRDFNNNNEDFWLQACPSLRAATATCEPSVPGSSVSGAVTGGSAGPPSVESQPPSSSLNHLVILEVQTTGGAGATDHDFVKIYNPGSDVVNVYSWKLRKRTQSGSESSVRVFPDGATIVGGGNFLWANSNNNFATTVSADVSSTQTLADNNSLALLDTSSTVVDAVAWGTGLTNPFVEFSPYPANPGSNQPLKRKMNNGFIQDTDNNALDFELR